MVFCGILYKHGLSSWFQQDDFPHLGLGLRVHNARDLFHALFDPMAQGTFRPISEKAFYMGFFALFGLNGAPYRALVFITQFANLALFGTIAYLLLDSYAAAFWAPVLWVANSALATPMTWTATYNEVLCSTCFLLAFYFLIRYTRTGEARFNRYQWIVFLLGFGVLETNTVYPLIAILYTALFSRRYLRSACWLLVPSAVFTVLESFARHNPSDNVYSLHFDLSMFSTAWQYWSMALGPSVAAGLFPLAHVPTTILTAVLSIALLGFAAFRTWRGDPKPAFFLGWFFLALSLYTPLRNHISDYYLTIPLIGLALLGAYAITRFPLPAYLFAAIYLVCAVPAARQKSKAIAVRSFAVKRLVNGVASAHRLHPADAILLDGVDYETFTNGVYDRPFLLVGADGVALTSASQIRPNPQGINLADYVMPEPNILAALRENRARVLAVEDGRTRDVTALFQQTALHSGAPTRLDVTRPPVPSLLGSGWYPAETNFRWMGKRATLTLGTPGGAAATLRISAACAAEQVRSKPLEVRVRVGNYETAPESIAHCESPPVLVFPVRLTTGDKQVTVAIEVDRTFRVGYDRRDLGLAVKAIELAKSK